ncbi:aspartate-semialdehyde dehydrogenase [Myxococcota bacterium]|nr:aspartate-semialdehyde dehydrogenase [Myxococcota bacterium]MBU1433184.1 aspartate-semialdehyde dehydrogenase [Myxococcota bacterium]MBU1896191.1 aspartate-semialdehyde dehydrogenase [Myxococcota bacterium]
MKKQGYVFAIVGATGAVGAEMLTVLAEQDIPIRELRLLASERSAGVELMFKHQSLKVQPISEAALKGVDYALFSAGTEISAAWAPKAAALGAVVVDNTRAFRMDPRIPLIVPEVNGALLTGREAIIANPNCSTIQLVVALKPLHDRFGLERVITCTYQSASGAGREAMDELRDQVVDLLNFREVQHDIFPRRLAFDVIPTIDQRLEDGYTGEEEKMIRETQKIMGLPDLPVSATCVRVPVFIGHCLSANVALKQAASREAAREALAAGAGIVLSEPGEFPTAADVAGQDEVYVGRVRVDRSNPRGLEMWVAADNLRKGAATNSVQIAALMIQKRGG